LWGGGNYLSRIKSINEYEAYYNKTDTYCSLPAKEGMGRVR
jgi:hypothetical protein